MEAIDDILDIFHEFSILEIEELNKELLLKVKELEEMHKAIHFKQSTLASIEAKFEEINLLAENFIEEHKKLSSELEEETAKRKRIKKTINQLNALNTDRAKIEISANDKIKMGKKKAKLDLMKKLSKAIFYDQSKGFLINPNSLDIKLFELAKKNTKKQNRDILWDSIGQISQFNNEWEQLFDN
ncbi:CLUMA_CG015812, isoform A [Clunio marinus]|uniref:CLUMA_CG015812, isoform A n=1 Tax=Clunio marinus TaxID=568069 RepID=A0A1J1IVI6_9DIPT|nr:CLUMA_CG015812, isoform A [Clunio marinus]